MQQLRDDISYFLRQKLFVVLLCITTVGCYGFAITHEGIGVDDTMVDIYIRDGMEVVMGRWTMYLVNKVFYFGEYMPFITEFAGALLLFVAAVLYCVLLKRIFRDKIGMMGYIAFACAFVSCPFISEVNIYYYHDGTDLGYVLCALSLLLFLDILDKKGKAAITGGIGSMLFLWAAVGCYESFIILYIIGVMLILFFGGVTDRQKITFPLLLRKLFLCFCLVVGCIALRSLMISFLKIVFSLQSIATEAKVKSASSGLRQLFMQDSWLSDSLMLLKKYWMVYCVNSVVYLPVTIYMLSAVVVGAASLIYAVRKKNIWYPVLFFGMMVVPIMLVFVQLRVPLYRCCQYMPLFVASAVILLYLFLVNKKWEKYGRVIFAALTAILVWNQAFEMNKNFYTDYKKYEYTREIMTDIAQRVMREYGSETPVIFTGDFAIPYELVRDYYASYSSPEYRRVLKISNWLGDPYLIEKFCTSYGYYYEGEAQYFLIIWGLSAFESHGRELMHFLQMHGYELQNVTDRALVDQAERFSAELPEYPAEGSIVEMDGYVIVHF